MLIEESRPPVQLIFALRFLCGTFLASTARGRSALAAAPVLTGLAGWLCLTAAVYVLNGWSDCTADRVNGSRRPIASGRLGRTRAAAACAVLATAGVLVSCRTVPGAAVALVMLLLGGAYSLGDRPLKSSAAGAALCIGGGAALTMVAGAAASGSALDGPAMLGVVGYGLWVALAANTKDLSDVDGDRLAGRRTWPVLAGRAAAARRIALAAPALTLSLLIAAQAGGILWPAAVVLAAGSAATSLCCWRLSRTSTTGPRTPYRLYMLTQYATILTCLTVSLPFPV